MPQIENKDLLERLLRSTIAVIGRRISEAYAIVIISSAIKELTEKFSFLNYVKIRGIQYTETFDILTIKSDINYFELALNEIKTAKQYFIQSKSREIFKEIQAFYLEQKLSKIIKQLEEIKAYNSNF